jgi:hypothetical protein
MAACLLAASLIAKCVGYLPAHGSSVAVERACVFEFSKSVRRAAQRCARAHEVKWNLQ